MRRSLAVSFALGIASPAAAAAGSGGGGGQLPIFELVNFALLIGAIVYFGRIPLREMFDERRKAIAKDIETASTLLEEAEARNAEWQRKLADLDHEIEDVRTTARRRAEEERERILAEASEAAERIQREAVASVEQELRRAQDALREEAAQLATELATGMLREQVGDGDRERLLDEFISRVEAAGARAEGGR